MPEKIQTQINHEKWEKTLFVAFLTKRSFVRENEGKIAETFLALTKGGKIGIKFMKKDFG